MKISLETPSTVEPITLELAKSHMRETSTAQDALIERVYIKAARKAIEDLVGGSLINQTWKCFLDGFPTENCIELPRSPLVSVTHVKYYDENNVLQTLDPSTYQVDTYSKTGKLALVYQEVWPATYYELLNSVEVQFVSGYGTSPESVPEPVIQALLLTVAHMYENRTTLEIPMGVSQLVSQYQTYTFL